MRILEWPHGALDEAVTLQPSAPFASDVYLRRDWLISLVEGLVDDRGFDFQFSNAAEFADVLVDLLKEEGCCE